jgi:membrane protein
MKSLTATWSILKETVVSFVEDDALSRGASIAFYTVTSIAPILLIVIAVAGLAFGREAAQNALIGELEALMGHEPASVLQGVIANASQKSSGVWATAVGLITLLIGASGVFAEMQTALNTIWGANPSGTTVAKLIRARAVSVGLVAALGFLLMVSLVVSAALTALGQQLSAVLPFGAVVLHIINIIVSLTFVTILLAAIYKVLPDTPIAWRDVILGAMVTAALFAVGKSLIGFYLGSSAIVSSYGAAGAVIVLLLWIYYSAQIFLLGAEFTKTYARQYRMRMQPA